MDVSSLWRELEDRLVPLLASFRSARSLRVTRKADSTLLSEADEAVQAEIIRVIRAADPDATILGEEGAHGPELLRGHGTGRRTWIIDPIDGTAQFVDSESREYCSVVCLVEGQSPVAAWVLAPEIGPGRSPVCVRLGGPGESVEVNGRPASRLLRVSTPQLVSVTRSAGTREQPYEQKLISLGYRLKTRTTSQTLDMVRTCVDLSPMTEPALEPFGLFYRRRQKIWDGAAGMCLAYATGIAVSDGNGRPRMGIDIALDQADPVFDSTLVASDAVAAQIVVDASE